MDLSRMIIKGRKKSLEVCLVFTFSPGLPASPRSPALPGSPGIPGLPGSPAVPGDPSGPRSPMALPGGPGIPVGPCSPRSPFVPLSPGNPTEPWTRDTTCKYINKYASPSAFGCLHLNLTVLSVLVHPGLPYHPFLLSAQSEPRTSPFCPQPPLDWTPVQTKLTAKK